MIERKLASKVAKSVLYEDFNDIDVYVEDTSIGSEKLYTEILQKATGYKHTIATIFPIGNSLSVINEWIKHKNQKNGRKKLFIIDGDFYIINNNLENKVETIDNNIEDLRGLFLLPRYCVENFLIEEQAILSLIDEEDLVNNYAQIEKNLNFSDWIKQNEGPLLELFIIYSVIIYYNLGIQNVQLKVNTLCVNGEGIVCATKINDKIDELKLLIEEKNNIGFNLKEEIEKRRKKIKSENNKLLKYVSGKDYLWPLLRSKIKKDVKLETDFGKIKLRLAKKGTFEELKDIFKHAM